MAAYLLAIQKRITDPDTFKEYGNSFGVTLEGYGATVIAASPGEPIEQTWAPLNAVIIEFLDLDTLKRWYHSAAYQAILPLRQRSAEVDILLIDGYRPG